VADAGRNMDGEDHQKNASPGRFALPSLFISYFAIWPAGLVITLLLIDIGQTFGSPVGITGQVQTLSFGVSVVSSLLLGLLSVRFRHKSLLLGGLLIIGVSVLGCALATSFNMLLVMYAVTGMGVAIANPMTLTLIGELFPIEKRTWAIGLIATGGTLSYVVGAPAVGMIVGIGGWRLSLLAYALPISILGLFLAAKGLPSPPEETTATAWRVDYLDGFKGVLTNGSAVACLLGMVLIMAAWQSVTLYSTSFYREVFSAPTSVASTYITIGSLTTMVGTLVADRFVDRLGRKSTTVISGLLVGVLLTAYPVLSELTYSLVARFLAPFFGGVMFTAFTSLSLEQVPEHRGAMMSISSAAQSLGGAIGAALGGVVLLWYGYQALGVTLGALGLVSILVYQLLVDETVKMDVDNG